MKTVCLIPSENGFGHLRRCIAISRALRKLDYETTLIWSNEVYLPRRLLNERDFSRVKRMAIPLMWDGPSVRSRNTFNDSELFRELSRFDLVISDTLLWPVFYAEKVILVAQFLWEFYYRRLGELDVFATLPMKIPKILFKTFGMSGFIWPEMRDTFDIQEVDILDYWNLRGTAEVETQKICISLSGTGRTSLPKIMSDWNLPLVSGLENFVIEKNEKPLAIICRPGLGIISECVSAKSVPILTVEKDIEMEYNSDVLINKWGIGLNVDSIKNLSKTEAELFVREFCNSIDWPEVTSIDDFALLISS